MTPYDLVGQNVELVSLPEVCISIQSMADDINCTAEEMGKVVGQDTALTAKLLKLVNSPYYGLRVPVDTITRAVRIIGAQELRNLALASSAIETFSGISSDLVDMVIFWRHSIFCGLLSRRIAARCNILHPERLFIVGLLHDVGRLLIFAKLPEQAQEVLNRYNKDGSQVCEAEKAVLGFDHAEVGSKLMALWNMPKALQEAVAFHHMPELAQEAPVESRIVYVANEITNHIERLDAESPSPYYDPYGTFLSKQLADIEGKNIIQAIEDKNAVEVLGLKEEEIGKIIKEAGEGFEEVLNLFYPIGQMLE
jgi:HD-like signal output (HDOD) protein